MIKLLALDIDGTLMNRDYILREPVIKAIKRVIEETDIKVVLASGRMINSTIPVAEQLGITTPLITYQGALIKDFKTGKVFSHLLVPPDLALQLVFDMEEEGIHVNIYLNDTLCMKQITDIALSYSSARYVTPQTIEDYSIINIEPPTKIVGLDSDVEKIARITKKLKQKYLGKLSIFSSMPEYVEAVNPDISKGKALVKFAKEYWDIDPQDIMAIGDGDNDAEMVSLVGYGIAMGNAVDEVKSVARYVTKSVSEFGAAYAIEKFIFNEVN